MIALGSFAYHRPTKLEQALALLAEHGAAARVLGGGTDLLGELRAGAIEARHVVSLRDVESARRIEVSADGALRIGARATLSEVGRHQAVRRRTPALARACAVMATRLIRNMGTVAGNLVNGSPCADTAPPLLVVDAALALASARGQRTLALADMFLGPGKVALEPDELVTSIVVPALPARTGSAYQRLGARSKVDMAAASAAARLTLDDAGNIAVARIALGAVAPTPLRCPEAEATLVGAAPTAEALAAAGRAAAAAASPIDDVRASAAYRCAVLPVLARRALEAAASLARGEQP